MRSLMVNKKLKGMLLLILPFFIYSQNIILNPSFEIWLDTLGVRMPLGWLTSELRFPNSAIKTTEARSGEFALKLIGGDSVAFATTTTIVRPGETYYFNGWTKCQSFVGGSFILTFLKPLGDPIGTPIMIPIGRSTDYRNYNRTVTAPDSAFWIVVGLTTLPYVTVYVDDVTLDSSFGAIKEAENLSSVGGCFQKLLEVAPNPFKSRTVIRIPSRFSGTIGIYDINGRVIRKFGIRNSEFGIIAWDGKDKAGIPVNPGVYFVKLSIGNKIFTNPVILLKTP